MSHYIKGMIRNKSLVFGTIATMILVVGFLWVAQAPGVEGAQQGPTPLSCPASGSNTPNKGICSNNNQCASGFCAGTTGQCTTVGVGTCQDGPSVGGSDVGDIGGFDDFNPGGGGGGTTPVACTAEFPIPPTFVSASFSGSYNQSGSNTLNITIPGSGNQGTGSTHQIAVILASQDIDSVSDPIWWDFRDVRLQGWNFSVNLTSGMGYANQPLKVYVRNFKDCNPDGQWSQWRASGTVSQSSSGGDEGGDTGGSSCTGTVPSGATQCPGDNDGTTAWTLKSSCSSPAGSSPKCEAVCQSGYVLSRGSCIPASFSCTGAQASNANMCSGDDSGLTENTEWSLVSACTSQKKCEQTCASNFTLVNGSCVQNAAPEVGNVYGWAWSSNIGWIKMNSCEDANLDGETDPGSCSGPAFGVTVNNGGTLGGSGSLSGHAWNNHIGWIEFGNSLGTAPTGGSSSATLTNVSSDVGTISGWARAVTGMAGNTTPGFEGWISLAGTNYPSGANYLDGDGGLTYNRLTARIVGAAWGGEAIGWIKFSDEANNYHKVTYGKPAPFAYTMAVSPTTFTYSDPAAKDFSSDVTLTLTSGITQPVNITTVVMPPPTAGDGEGIDVTLGGSNCSPPCARKLNIHTYENSVSGDYKIIITAKSAGVADQVKEVHVLVPSNFSASCTVDGNSPYFVNTPVTWRVAVDGEVEVDNVIWNGTNVVNQSTGQSLTFTKTYSTTGVKNVNVTVTDASGTAFGPVVCSETATVIVQPNVNEF